MKIVIYAIAKNEERCAERFMHSCKGADVVIVGDTGSTDRTKEILGSRGATLVNLAVEPWRFDVPRNTVLSLVPSDADLCIKLDIDEVLTAGWRDRVEENFKPGEHSRIQFRYVHDFLDNGKYGVIGTKNFIHTRNNYMWRYAVHEQLYYTGADTEKVCVLPELVIEHHPDPDKDRSNYLPLLELETADKHCNPQHVFWLGHEYAKQKKHDRTIKTMQRFLDMGGNREERCDAMLWLGRACTKKRDFKRALTWFLKACQENPEYREAWVELAWHFQRLEKWPQAYGAIKQGLDISHRPESYLTDNNVWDWRPHDLAALCAYKLGLTDEMKEQLSIAVSIAPDNEELIAKAERLGAA